MLYDVAAVREAEQGLDEAMLIQRASTAVARRAASMLGGTYGRRVLVVAGPGHNGADALWAGVRLAERGAAVDVLLPLGEPRDEHGVEPLRRLRRAPGAGGSYDLAIDGVLGVGARLWAGEPPAWTYLPGPVLAVDVPSGVDAGTGEAAPGAVRADVTVTFVPKAGLYVGAGAAHAGLVEVADIGLRPRAVPVALLVTARRAGRALGPAFGETDKYRRGVVGVVAGSERYPGAAVLACRGALRAGAGYVRLVAPRSVADAVRATCPEVVASEGDLPKADAWVVGPGLGDDARDLVAAVLATRRPAVVDAGAIALAERSALYPDVVLTPHTGEFERLTGVPRADAERDRVGVARRAAEDLGATVLLKGSTTVVASPHGDVYVNPTGTPLLATAGTGDVLSGVIGALLPRESVAENAAVAGAWLHGMAARLAGGDPPAAVTALDVAERIPDAARIALASC